MCLSISEPGGPARCSADLAARVDRDVLRAAQHQDTVAGLHSEREQLDRDLEMIRDMEAAMSGTLSPDREAELLEKASRFVEDRARSADPDPDPDLELEDAGDDIDVDAPGRADAGDRTWQNEVTACLADVDQAWAAVRDSNDAFILDPAKTRDQWMEEYEQWAVGKDEVASRYEAAVRRVGEVIGAEADRRAEQRLAEAGPEPVLVTRADVFAKRNEVLQLIADARTDPSLADAARNAERAYNDLVDRYANDHHPFRITQTGRIRADTYREVLNEVRPLGGATPQIAGRPAKESVAQLHKVADDMPAEWIDDINSRVKPLTLSRRKGVRASYNSATHRITTSGWDAEAYHEFAHRIEEQVPAISVATDSFLRRRTTQPDGTREPERHYGSARSGEKIRPDGFVEGYVGKSYLGPYTEVFSVGTEALFTGRFGGFIGDGNVQRSDPEHRNLILGLFASAKVTA